MRNLCCCRSIQTAVAPGGGVAVSGCEILAVVDTGGGETAKIVDPGGETAKIIDVDPGGETSKIIDPKGGETAPGGGEAQKDRARQDLT